MTVVRFTELPLSPLVLALALATTGCARLVPAVNFSAAGTADAAVDDATDSVMRAAIKHGVPGSERVLVLVDAAPEGIRMDAGRPIVEPTFQHQVLGKVSIDARSGGFFFIASFLDYRETWRKALCYWQVPLEWFTLGIWSLVPTSYGCFAGAAYLSKEDVLADVRNAAMSIHADTVLLTYSKEKNEKVRSVTGWMLKLGPRVQAVPVVAAPPAAAAAALAPGPTAAPVPAGP